MISLPRLGNSPSKYRTRAQGGLNPLRHLKKKKKERGTGLERYFFSVRVNLFILLTLAYLCLPEMYNRRPKQSVQTQACFCLSSLWVFRFRCISWADYPNDRFVSAQVERPMTRQRSFTNDALSRPWKKNKPAIAPGLILKPLSLSVF